MCNESVRVEKCAEFIARILDLALIDSVNLCNHNLFKFNRQFNLVDRLSHVISRFSANMTADVWLKSIQFPATFLVLIKKKDFF